MSKVKGSYRNGFTLVELSIVIIILSLMVGGILGGQSLIHASQLRAIGTEHSSWSVAVNTFKESYKGFPGDIRNATFFWGAADTSDAGECGDPSYDEGTGTETCNGDGNGRIENWELVRFWQHLSNAGYVTGEYTGIAGWNDPEHMVLGENTPKSKCCSAGWSMAEYPSWGDAYFFTIDNPGNVFVFGGQHDWGPLLGKVLTPSDSWNVDTKFDDGKPGKGQVLVHWWDDCTDATASDDNDADYLLSEAEVQCNLIFTKVF
jgi:prepilin-type N-terminal cleavage/methylation domain-containing protein